MPGAKREMSREEMLAHAGEVSEEYTRDGTAVELRAANAARPGVSDAYMFGDGSRSRSISVSMSSSLL